jgi:hypothetical protein
LAHNSPRNTTATPPQYQPYCPPDRRTIFAKILEKISVQALH